MPTTVAPGIGTKLSVSNAIPATEDTTGYDALTWTVVGEITEIPEYGADAEVVTHVPLATGITQKYHGPINYGSLTVPYAMDRDDAGQVLLETIRNTRVRASFKIEYSDGGSIDYVQGKVFSIMRGASSNAAVSGSVKIEFETAIVPKAAA